MKLACDQKVPETAGHPAADRLEGQRRQFYPEPKLKPIDWKKIRADC